MKLNRIKFLNRKISVLVIFFFLGILTISGQDTILNLQANKAAYSKYRSKLLTVSGQDLILNLQANDLAYSKSRSKIFAVVSSYGYYYPGSIVRMDPQTGTVEESCLLLSDPMKIKLTKDEKFAYISYNDTSFITRIDLEKMQIDNYINLNTINDMDDHLYCFDFDIIPNSNIEIVVSRSDGVYGRGYFVDLVLYRDGIVQPQKFTKNMPNTPSNWDHDIGQIAVSSNGQFLYGYNNQSTHFQNYVFNIEDDGLTILSQYGAIIDEFCFLKIHNDTIYTRNGKIIDPFNTDIPTLIATCPADPITSIAQRVYEKYGFTYSEYHNAYVFPYYSEHGLYLRLFNSKNFVFKDAIFIEAPEELNVENGYLIQIEEINNGKFAIIMTDYSDYYFIYLANSEKSNNAFLTDLRISDWGVSDPNLYPNFDPFEFNYEIELKQSWWWLTPEIYYEAAHPLATVKIERSMGVPSQTMIKVTAEDGITTNTYYINYVPGDYY